MITKIYETNEVESKGGNSFEGRFYQPVYEQKQFVKFYGMSSETTNEKHFGGLKDYRNQQKEKKSLFPSEEVLELIIYIGIIRST